MKFADMYHVPAIASAPADVLIPQYVEFSASQYLQSVRLKSNSERVPGSAYCTSVMLKSKMAEPKGPNASVVVEFTV